MNKFKTRMMPWLYVVMVALAMGVSACGGDDDDPVTPNSNPNTGKNNTTDKVVTGGVGEIEITLNDHAGYFSTDITGYLNLSDDEKLAYGQFMEYGIEVSEDATLNGARKIKAEKMQDNRKFEVRVDYLDRDNTTYYYRAYLGGGAMNVYGKIESFRTGSAEEAVNKIKVTTTAEVTKIKSFAAEIQNGSNNIAYSTDKSKLTAENIKNRNVSIAEEGPLVIILDNLAEHTTYYYCNYRIYMQKYVVMGDIKSFTTTSN